MSCSSRSGAHCPQCGTTVSLSLAAQLQSEQLGVACDCPQCEHQWIYRIDSGSPDDAARPTEMEPHLSSPPHRIPTTTPVPTIFIVEDDDAVRDALDGLMGSMGWQTRLYTSAEDFQQRCSLTRPGCLLLDVHLPGMSGVELLSILHQIDCPTPVILMTESLQEHVLEQAQNSNAFAFFPKPFNIRALLAGIRSALKQSDTDPAKSNDPAKSDSGDFARPC